MKTILLLFLALASVAHAQPSFAAPSSFDADSGALGTTAGNLDGDTADEFVSAASDDSADPHLRIYDWDGSATDVYTILNGAGVTAYQDRFGGDIAIADVDDDGDNDIVTIDCGNSGTTGSLIWFSNPGSLSGTWTANTASTWSGSGTGNVITHAELESGDINGDGFDDIVVRDISHGSWVFINNQADAFQTRKFLPHNAREGLALADLDSDGDLDVVINGAFYLTPSDPVNGTYTLTEPTGIDTNWYPSGNDATTIEQWACKVAVADFNADGNPDIVITNAEELATSAVKPEGVTVYLAPANPASGTWTGVSIRTDRYSWHNLRCADFDWDGDIDIVSSISKVGLDSDSNYETCLWKNNGSGTSWTEQDIQTSVSGYQLAMGDYDGDGDQDLMLPDDWASGPIRYFQNTTSLGGATSEARYGITWTWQESRSTGTFANGDPWVVGPITLTSITPQTALDGARRINGSMINPVPGFYASQGWDNNAYILNYSDSLNIALVGGNPISGSNTRTVPAGSSICSIISNSVVPINSQSQGVPSDFAVLTVLASAPAAGSFRPPYTGTNKAITWNKSQLNYGILRNLTPVTGQSAPTSAAFARPWVEIEMNYNQSRSWAATNNQPTYDKDNSDRFAYALLELHTNYTNAQKELAYVRLVQYGIDIYGQVKNGMWMNEAGSDWIALQDGAQSKPALVLAALALDDADMKTYVDGPNFIPNPYLWSPLGKPRFGLDAIIWSVGDVNNSDDVGRALESGNQQYVAGDVGNPEWGPDHWGDRDKDSAAWGKLYRDVRYNGHVGLALAMQLTIGARELWNNQVVFDYFDRARGIYRAAGNDGSGEVLPLVWEAYRSLGGPIWPANAATVFAPTASPAAGTYGSTQSVTLTSATSGSTIYYTTNGSTPTTGSPVYSTPISISATTTLKAFATKATLTDSAVATFVYTIGGGSGTLTTGTLNVGTLNIGN